MSCSIVCADAVTVQAAAARQDKTLFFKARDIDALAFT
jgi:hypothetical protein